MTSYEKLNEMYRENEFAFKTAISLLINCGTKNAIKITDEEIEKAHMPFMEDWLAQMIYKFAREISEIANKDCGAFIKFCIVEKIYDTKGFKPKKRK